MVQGVGFRPLVFNLAGELGLAGFVRNQGNGVTLELEGPPEAIQSFERALRERLPSPARIDALERAPLRARGESAFVIAPSRPGGQGALIPPDLASCPDCLAELLDPADRRFGYPLLNCTRCGPRYTVIQALPYDRSRTTMAGFPLCRECLQEYQDPHNRRFHAQPTACPACGPSLWTLPPSPDPVARAREVLLAGGIVAVKGLGGYHLACRPEAAAHLRARKARPHRPLALMVRDLETARQWAHLEEAEEAWLAGPERPIVLLPARDDPGPLAPAQRQLGLLLPYTPLHELLLQPPLDSLVMTSGNRSGEPICRDHPETLERFCDLVLGHDRPIAAACEDSVLQSGPRGPLPVRRSRGYVPRPVEVACELIPVLAVGAELKNTVALAAGRQVWLSGHVGDVASPAGLQRLEETARHLEGLLGFAPERLAADLHPDALARGWAQSQGLPVVLVQHHHAHVASLLAEHGWPPDREVLAFVLDGTGWGTDGTLWGGEVLRADYDRFERLAWLEPARLPGGEAAIRAPYRLALSYLERAGVSWDPRLPPVGQAPAQELRNLGRVPGPTTSSMGRLFDAVASLLGVCHRISYEGQAACELEAACEPDSGSLELPLEGRHILWRGALAELARQLLAGVAPGILACRFHNAVADMVVDLSRRLARGRPVALSGGCFHNQRLLRRVVRKLEQAEIPVLVHRQVPANDGGLALGQAVVAGRRAGKKEDSHHVPGHSGANH